MSGGAPFISEEIHTYHDHINQTCHQHGGEWSVCEIMTLFQASATLILTQNIIILKELVYYKLQHKAINILLV